MVKRMDDLISRQAAIDAIRESTSKYTGFMDMEMYTDDDAVEAIEGIPPAQPKRNKGIWLPDNRCGGGYWVCSSCKNPTEAFAANVLYKYCPFCGADMRGEKNGN